jgi:protein disulfide-isomerase
MGQKGICFIVYPSPPYKRQSVNGGFAMNLWLGTVISCVACLMGCCSKERTPPVPEDKPTAMLAMAESSQGITWLTSYPKALEMAKKTNRPVALVFTGSDWCAWCKKLERDILNTQAFADRVKDQMIFVMLDFPRNPTDEHQARENERLRDQFNVEGFPTIVVVNGEGEVLGTLGYRAISPEQYGDTLLMIAQKGTAFAEAMRSFDPTAMTLDQIRELYSQAEMVSRSEDAARLLRVGLDKEPKDPFFLAQHYRTLLEGGQYGSAEALDVRQKLVESHLGQGQELPFFVAFLDFRALSEDTEADHSTEMVLAPLEQFLVNCPSTDSRYRWRAEMIMGEYLASMGHKEEAAAHLQAALKGAPDRVKQHLQKSLDLVTPQEMAAN